MRCVCYPGWVLVASALLMACASTSGPTEPVSRGPASDQSRASTLARDKLDSRLRDALDRIQAGGSPASDRNPVDVDSNGRVLVDITAVVTPTLLGRIEMLGGAIISRFPEFEAVRARVPFEQLLALAEDNSVKTVRPAEEAVTRSGSEAPTR